MQSVINSNQSKLLDLETLTEFEGHLKYAETAISRLHFPQPLSDSLINQIQTIRERGSDEKLYLAVIGESSTGKTTLINAFLRDEILKAQATTMTTASATILSYDPDLSVEVRFIKENKDEGGFLSGLARLFGPKSNETVIDAPELEFLTENNSAQISTVIRVTRRNEPITIRWLPGIRKLTIKEFIHRVTARADNEERNDIAQRVLSATVKHPARFLSNGICLIDAPGMNSTDPQHTAVIEDVAAQADTALIIVPATKIASVSLQDFLARETIQRYLHRCVFLVTFMDEIPVAERDKLLNTVRQRLKTSGKITFVYEPEIYACCAQSVVDTFAIEQRSIRDQQDWQQWQASFAELEQTILNKLKRERQFAISENLISLLKTLFSLINDPLEKQWQIYREEQRRLEQDVIQDVSSFASEQTKSCSAQFMPIRQDRRLKAREIADRHLGQLLTDLKQGLDGVTDKGGLDNFIKKQSAALIDADQKAFELECQTLLNVIETDALQLDTQFEQRFQAAYKKLEGLRVLEIAIHANRDLLSTSGLNIPGALQQVVASHKELDDAQLKKNALIGVGVGVAAIVALHALLPVAIVAGIGAVVINNFFGPKLEERKTKAWGQIQPKVVEAYEAATQTLLENTQAYVDQLEHRLNEKIQAHVTRYKSVIDAVRQAQTLEHQRLKTLQNSVQADIDQIQARQNRLEQQRQHLLGLR